jgi:hypothetical protein
MHMIQEQCMPSSHNDTIQISSRSGIRQVKNDFKVWELLFIEGPIAAFLSLMSHNLVRLRHLIVGETNS